MVMYSWNPEKLEAAKAAGRNWDLLLSIFTQEDLIEILDLQFLRQGKKRLRKKRFKALMRDVKLRDMLDKAEIRRVPERG